MARFDYVLAITMAISLIWGIVILALGTVIRFNFGKLLNSILEGLDELDLEGCKGPTKQDICPVTKMASDDIDLGDWVPLIGTFVILAGFLVTLFSAVGFVAALKHSTPLIVVFIVLCLTATGLQFYLVQIATSEDNGFHQTAKSQLKEKLAAEYMVDSSQSPFTQVFNGIQLMMQCCGVDGIRDFQNLTFFEKYEDSGQALNVKTFTSPPSCCKKSRFFCTSCTERNYLSITECARRGYNSMDRVNTKGCYSEMFHYVGETSGPVIMGILLFIIVWEMLQIVFGILVKFTPPLLEEPPPPTEPEPKPSLPKVESPPVVQVEQYIPHARPSTFDHPDLNRIKSTEIW